MQNLVGYRMYVRTRRDSYRPVRCHLPHQPSHREHETNLENRPPCFHEVSTHKSVHAHSIAFQPSTQTRKMERRKRRKPPLQQCQERFVCVHRLQAVFGGGFSRVCYGSETIPRSVCFLRKHTELISIHRYRVYRAESGAF